MQGVEAAQVWHGGKHGQGPRSPPKHARARCVTRWPCASTRPRRAPCGDASQGCSRRGSPSHARAARGREAAGPPAARARGHKPPRRPSRATHVGPVAAVAPSAPPGAAGCCCASCPAPGVHAAERHAWGRAGCRRARAHAAAPSRRSHHRASAQGHSCARPPRRTRRAPCTREQASLPAGRLALPPPIFSLFSMFCK